MTRTNQRRIDPAIQKAARRHSMKRIGSMLAFVLLIAASASGALWLNQSWRVQHWEISAEAPIKAAIEAQLQHMPNRDFLHTRPEALRQQWLQQIPDMAAVRITRILPDRLQVQADARVPTALWQDAQGRLHLFDSEGHAYRLLSRGESPDLPLLRVSEEQLGGTQRMLTTLAHVDTFPLASLSEVRASGGNWHIYFSHGVSWLIPQSNETAVIKHIVSLMKQPRWHHRYWRVDARLASRWFIRPAGHGGVI